MRRVGAFMIEGLCDTKGVSRTEAERQAVEQLQAVRIADPERCLRQYPHQLSGGMLQRVMIASTLMAEPRLILADEPTTALDVTTQAEVVAILDALRRERGLSMLFISHDLELARAVTHRTAVMYAGEIVEVQASDRLHSEPLHPYSAALVASRPSIDHTLGRLPSIPGRAIPAFEAPTRMSVQAALPTRRRGVCGEAADDRVRGRRSGSALLAERRAAHGPGPQGGLARWPRTTPPRSSRSAGCERRSAPR